MSDQLRRATRPAATSRGVTRAWRRITRAVIGRTAGRILRASPRGDRFAPHATVGRICRLAPIDVLALREALRDWYSTKEGVEEMVAAYEAAGYSPAPR